MLKVLVLTRYARLGASSRVRFLEFMPRLAERGFAFDVLPLLDDDYVRAIYSGRRPGVGNIAAGYLRRVRALVRRRSYDLIWLEKEALPWVPAGIERAMLAGVPYVVDLDDAWFFRYDAHRSAMVRWLLRGKIGAVVRRSSLAVVGNEYLAAYARDAGAARIEILASAIDLDRYPAAGAAGPHALGRADKAIIGWIGTPHTVSYLAEIEPALRPVLSAGGAKLHVVGAPVPASLADLPSASIRWDESTEIAEISRFDIGIMPLAEGKWEKGKCGYKLLQVMAAERPVIASAVGANVTIVQDGVNGFLASSHAQWVKAMRRLIDDVTLRRRMGLAARRTVEADYSLTGNVSRLASALTRIARPGNPVVEARKAPAWPSLGR